MPGMGHPPGHFHDHGRQPRGRQSHPIFSDFKGGSRKAFSKFISERGIFGDRPLPEEEKPRQPEAGKGEPDGPPDKYEAKHAHRAYLRRFFALVGGRALGLMLAVSALSVAARAVMPWAAKLFIDKVWPLRDLHLHYCVLAAFVTVCLASVVFMTMEEFLSRKLMGNFITDMRLRMMKHLHGLPLHRLQELKVGGIITRLQSDTEAMTGLLESGILTPFNACLMLVTCLGSLFLVNWRVTLICLGFCLLIVMASYLFFRRIRPLQRLLREDFSQISSHVAEMFGGITVVRAFSRSRTETLAFGRETDLLWRKRFHANLLNMTLHRFVFTVYVLLAASIWGVGGYFYLRHEISVGDIMVFHFFIHWLFQPIFMVMGSFAEVQRSLACTERVFDLLDEPEAMPDRSGATEAASLTRTISFEDVFFAYEKDKTVLEGVSFDIPAGKVTALVGPSGSGKSTIVNLLMRFYDPSGGRVTFDGTDIRDLKLAGYRRMFGLVLQDVFLFDGKVKENIAYGDLDATDERIAAAARTANCHEFISALEEGYDSLVGERGVKLSGGQRQRLALARAVLADPQVLVLDEATSNLDSESEALIQDALREILKGRTTLVIAHRLSTVMDADNIIVLDGGRKVEEGTHAELLELKGRYFDLYTTQMQKDQQAERYLNWDEIPGPRCGCEQEQASTAEPTLE